jgi:hypothetical protein
MEHHCKKLAPSLPTIALLYAVLVAVAAAFFVTY